MSDLLDKPKRTTKKTIQITENILSNNLKQSDYEEILNEIVSLIKSKKYTSALNKIIESNCHTKEFKRIRIFLEIHLLNTGSIHNPDDYFIDNFSHAKYLKEIQKKKESKRKRKRKNHKFNEFFVDEKLMITDKVEFILSQRESISENYEYFTFSERYEYLKQIIEITEEHIIEFLKKEFDLQVFDFFHIYTHKRRKFSDEINDEKFSFLTEKKYIQDLNADELLTIYKFTDNFDIFLNSLLKNPFISKKKISDVFRKHMPDELSSFAKKVLTFVLECNYIQYLYKRAKKEQFHTETMRIVKIRTKRKDRCIMTMRIFKTKLKKEKTEQKIEDLSEMN